MTLHHHRGWSQRKESTLRRRRQRHIARIHWFAKPNGCSGRKREKSFWAKTLNVGTKPGHFILFSILRHAKHKLTSGNCCPTGDIFNSAWVSAQYLVPGRGVCRSRCRAEFCGGAAGGCVRFGARVPFSLSRGLGVGVVRFAGDRQRRGRRDRWLSSGAA